MDAPYDAASLKFHGRRGAFVIQSGVTDTDNGLNRTAKLLLEGGVEAISTRVTMKAEKVATCNQMRPNREKPGSEGL